MEKFKLESCYSSCYGQNYRCCTVEKCCRESCVGSSFLRGSKRRSPLCNEWVLGGDVICYRWWHSRKSREEKESRRPVFSAAAAKGTVACGSSGVSAGNSDWLTSTRGSCDSQGAEDVLTYNDAGVGRLCGGRGGGAAGSTGTPSPSYVRSVCDWHKLSLFPLPFVRRLSR